MTGTAGPRSRHRGSPQPAKAPVRPDVTPLVSIARQVRGWADTVLGIAGPATDLAFGLARSSLKDPKSRAAIGKAGALLRRMRELAGLSIQEVAHAIDITDPALIEQAEGGKAALPFELILRLAAVLGRGDPITSMMRLTRAYNPGLWKTLEELGVGRLVVQAGREREVANIYRANDTARRLSDEDFAQVLAFTKNSFDLAVAFRFPATKKMPE